MSGEKVYEVLARCFRQEGVETCFALLGDTNMNRATRLSDAGCRMIYVRNEHCTVAMAFARTTGNVGTATIRPVP